MLSCGWGLSTAAPALRSLVPVWSSLPEFPGMLNLTSALRPLAETSDAAPELSGERISAADLGRARRPTATCCVACRISGSAANVRPGARAWISTLSAGGEEATFSRFRVRSACPDWPASYCCTFLAGIIWPPTKTAATRKSQPSTAVLRCRALQPAIRSTTGGRERGRGGCRAACSGGAKTDERSMENLNLVVGCTAGVVGCAACEDSLVQPGLPRASC